MDNSTCPQYYNLHNDIDTSYISHLKFKQKREITANKTVSIKSTFEPCRRRVASSCRVPVDRTLLVVSSTALRSRASAFIASVSVFKSRVNFRHSVPHIWIRVGYLCNRETFMTVMWLLPTVHTFTTIQVQQKGNFDYKFSCLRIWLSWENLSKEPQDVNNALPRCGIGPMG